MKPTIGALAASFLLISLSACGSSGGGGGSGTGGSSPATNTIPQEDACRQAAEGACAKLFSCNDEILKAAQMTLGGTVAACQTKIESSYCSAFTCSASQTYHGDRAKQCKDAFGTVSCSTLASAALQVALSGSTDLTPVFASVPECNGICTPAGP